MKKLTGLDRLIWTRTEPPLASGQSGCDERSWGRGLLIEDSNQSASGWWQPVCRFARLRTHARRHLVLHMAGCMSRTHARSHHSSQMSGCMTRTHARRHSSTHMSISMLRLHARIHLALGRSTSCFYMSGCMYSFHASVDTQLVRWLTPRSERMQRAKLGRYVATERPSPDRARAKLGHYVATEREPSSVAK
ncbi:hypothetical protein F2Q69_00005876 [Brassica cretica]|uniref:Uncharacterized protein n=1 Tax=Brassica cretica TaxID=69181 RepID=A0A8S9PBY9_BRACR|nr:hypothetical protein F2Q69_00005876 [Brassica cretica]